MAQKRERDRALAAFSSHKSDNQNFDDLYKILVIGDAAVGKTGILQRFIDSSFTEEAVTTLGIDFKVRNVVLDGGGLKLQVWDTAGSERYRTMTSAFYRGTHGLIVTYDITRESSFEHAKTWIDTFLDESGIDRTYLPILLIGNKIDLTKERKITRARAEKFAIKNGIRVIEVSARTGENIEEAFFTLARDIKRIREQKRNTVSTFGDDSSVIKIRPAPKSLRKPNWFSRHCSVM